MSALSQMDRILRGEPLRDPAAVKFALGPLVALNVLLAATYGACLGTFALLGRDEPEWRQVVASAFKVPLLFVVTLVVTLPSLYVFAALLGSRFRLIDLLRVVAAGTSVIVALLASFGPIVAFFAVSSTSYSFILLLNVTVFAVAGGFGVSYLYRAAVAASVPPPEIAEPEPEEGEPTNYPSRLRAERLPEGGVGKLFLVWVVVFGLVGAQTGWILRPFVGSPDLPFTWFRPKQGSFFEGVGKSLESVLGSKRSYSR